MAILMLGLAFSLGGLMFLARFERDAHDRKTAAAVYGVMAAAALVAFVGPVLSEITSELNGML